MIIFKGCCNVQSKKNTIYLPLVNVFLMNKEITSDKDYRCIEYQHNIVHCK